MNWRSFIMGITAGAMGLALLLIFAMPSMMLKEHISPYGVAETVTRLEAEAKLMGWTAGGKKDLSAAIKKNGGVDLPEVVLLELCHAKYAGAILIEDKSRKLSVLMPCTISVYKANDGTTRVATMNAGLMGKLFGGKVAKVFGTDVANDQTLMVSEALNLK